MERIHIKALLQVVGIKLLPNHLVVIELGLQTPRHFYPPSPGHGNFFCQGVVIYGELTTPNLSQYSRLDLPGIFFHSVFVWSNGRKHF